MMEPPVAVDRTDNALTRMPWLLNLWTKEPHRSSNPGTT
jgi:hypothetical protein